jgi:DNA-binding CsgD family transcriptional regulator
MNAKINIPEQQVVDFIKNVVHHACSDIAARLHLSEGTVRNHVSAIFAKLDVSDRTQAAVMAIQHGLGDG